jgi:LemA protein
MRSSAASDVYKRQDYNNAIEMFPTNIMASMMNLTKKEVFNIPEKEKENIKVNF